MHLAPNFYFFAKANLLVSELPLRKFFWIRLNPRFSVPPRNLENSTKTPPFCFATEFEENGSSGCCDLYPGRLNISVPLNGPQCLQDGAIHFRKGLSNAFQKYNQLFSVAISQI